MNTVLANGSMYDEETIKNALVEIVSTIRKLNIEKTALSQKISTKKLLSDEESKRENTLVTLYNGCFWELTQFNLDLFLAESTTLTINDGAIIKDIFHSLKINYGSLVLAAILTNNTLSVLPVAQKQPNPNAFYAITYTCPVNKSWGNLNTPIINWEESKDLHFR